MNVKDIGAGALIFIGTVVLIVGLSVGIFVMRVVFAPQIGEGEARITINSGDMRIGAYNHFFNLCAAIQADEASIDAQNALLTDTTDGDDASRISQNIAALQANRGRSIATYNADAAKDYTIGQFRDSDLPYYIQPGQYEPDGKGTSCRS